MGILLYLIDRKRGAAKVYFNEDILKESWISPLTFEAPSLSKLEDVIDQTWSLSGVENRPKLVPVDSQSTQTEVQLLLDNWTQAEPSTTDVASSATRKDLSIRRKNETRYARCFQEGTTLPYPFPRGGLKVPPTKPPILPLSFPEGG